VGETGRDHCLLQVKTRNWHSHWQIPHLFERFHQAEGSANRSYEGSGLGLALVKELVELHKGQIGVGLRRRKHYSLVANWDSSPTLDQVLEVRQKCRALP